MITDTNQALPDHIPFAVKEVQAGEYERMPAEHWERRVKALRAMNELNQEHIVQFVTAFRRRKEHGQEEHYLVFEWADGGNLRNMWRKESSPKLTVALIKDTMSQILGLARALEAAHNLDTTGTSYRHGDIKPENVLCFSNGRTVGTLKIGDWGEGKEHGLLTEMRPSEIATAFGTRLYEAPEVETKDSARYLGQARQQGSRMHDVWAMGCIMLEFVIWLLKGWEGLVQFHHDLGERSFYEISVVNGKKLAQVHSAAIIWMTRMAEDTRCLVGSTAIGDLLEVVQTRLLVVKLPRRFKTQSSDILERYQTSPMLKIGSEVYGSATGDGLSSTGDAPHPPSELPTFNITMAEPEPGTIPMQPEPESPGPPRCLATDFRARMDEIVEADEEDCPEGYWGTH